MAILQLRNHIPICGASNREPVDGTESPMRVTLGFEPGRKARGRLTLTRIANPYLVDLNRKTSETIFLTILDNDEVLYVDCVESLELLRTAERACKDTNTGICN